MRSNFIAYGAIYALLGVALGAFGAHGLEGKLTERMLEVYETGVRYQMYHALGLLLIGAVADRLGHAGLVSWAGRMLQTGIVIFSGSLYVLSLTGFTKLGIITPLGGAAFIAGWAFVIIAALKQGKTS
ncbi:DUF423 domain-containing protein [Paenibacillus sp. GCM10012307]|uniref:DUF423 domain-containing protein n=1 Tax=Paenibacillus roseus TaxID=2798579 RepID=A0A934J5X2_9BACL|nr:DUF423 domain-containing protein [Paenibacillus roseus]MBJ6362178.1 DUF423 domain-containing protein [Paenibacillus roseus]